MLLLALARRPRLLILDEPTSGLDPVARHEVLSEFMDVLRDEDRSILFSSHNTVDVERISDRITFIDRGRLVDSSDKEDFLERWRRIQLQIPVGTRLPELPHVVSRVVDGQFVTLTTNRFSKDLHLIPGVRRARRAAHEPRGDLRRECHAPPRGARPMNMLTRKLIAKEFYLNRWLIVGATGAGLAGLVIAAEGKMRFNIGMLIWLTTIIAFGVTLAMLSIASERKDRALQFVLSLPLSPGDYIRTKLLGLMICFLIPWIVLTVGAMALVLIRPNLPDGLLPYALLLCVFMLANFSVVLSGALHTSSEGVMTLLIIVTNMGVSLFIFMVGEHPGPL